MAQPQTSEDTSGQRWFGVRTRPNFEKIVATSLRAKEYEEFLPACITRRRWADRVKNIESPLFPGYLFCRFDFRRRHPVITTPGVLYIVGVGGQPVPVPDEEIASLRTVVDSRLSLQSWPYLRIGEAVEIDGGPLRGARGVVLDDSDCSRLVVSVSLLQRSVAVKIDRRWVVPAAIRSLRFPLPAPPDA
jgi:transcription antitermination factor NusG